MITVMRFNRFQPPTTYGPYIDIIVERITAIESKFDDLQQEERAIIHLIGGETVLICESVVQTWEKLSDERPHAVYPHL